RAELGYQGETKVAQEELREEWENAGEWRSEIRHLLGQLGDRCRREFEDTISQLERTYRSRIEQAGDLDPEQLFSRIAEEFLAAAAHLARTTEDGVAEVLR